MPPGGAAPPFTTPMIIIIIITEIANVGMVPVGIVLVGMGTCTRPFQPVNRYLSHPRYYLSEDKVATLGVNS